MKNRQDNRLIAAYMKVLKEQAEDTLPPETTEEMPPETTAQETEENLTVVTFKTSDPQIIDVFRRGFVSATFNVAVEGGEDEDGEPETETIEVDGTTVSDVEVIEPEGGEGGDNVCPECGNDPCTCGGDDDDVTECDDITECDDVTEDDDITEQEEEITEDTDGVQAESAKKKTKKKVIKESKKRVFKKIF
jgi:hypothetical protein